MNTSDIIKKYTGNDDERVMLSRMFDLAARAVSRNTYEFSSFLSPAERALTDSVSELHRMCSISFQGGYDGAERTVAVLCPQNIEYELCAPISVLSIFTKGEPLGHRDILGSVLGLGIKREKIGDIIDKADPPIFFCDEIISQYIIDHLERAGRNSVTVLPGSVGSIPKPEFDEITATVMSLRLDSIVSEGFSLSRTRAADIINHGNAYINGQQINSVSKSVAEGDKISVRGLGKLRLASVGGQSKKGRTFILIEKYK
ncbi:MAG: YlmH/Sll1252 family protein [Oscillospiraceae bacterium]